ncbi:MAG: ribbon-helix-helix domain-containing protein [Acidimicrobiales bacterium]
MGELDRLVGQGVFASRSQAVRAGLETLVTAHHRDEVDRRYEQGLVQQPETQDEIAGAAHLAVEAIHDEPWARWW